jgi:hypothetical protein
LYSIAIATPVEIIREQSFSGRDDAIAKLGEETWHAIVSTAGIRIRF